jgi:hypothetical protein
MELKTKYGASVKRFARSVFENVGGITDKGEGVVQALKLEMSLTILCQQAFHARFLSIA